MEDVLGAELVLGVEWRIAVGQHAVAPLEERRLVAQGRSHLIHAPDIERALALVSPGIAGVLGRHAVRVLGREKTTAAIGHLALHVLQRVLGNLGKERIGRRLRGLEERQHELGLVVEHLLEMRHAPGAVHRVAMKAAADVIAHAAQGHGPQGLRHHVARAGFPGARVLAQQEQQLARPRELRRVAKAAAAGIEGSLELLQRGGQGLGARGARVRLPLGQHGEPLHDLHRRLRHREPLLAPRARDLQQHVSEAGPASLRSRREVGAAIERAQVGREPHAHGPAARAGGDLHEGHVDPIHVGTLLAIHLHRNEVLVQHGGQFEVLERLARHYVAPMARGVADGEKDGLAGRARGREGLVAPRVPVDRIMGVLQQIGTLLASEAIGH